MVEIPPDAESMRQERIAQVLELLHSKPTGIVSAEFGEEHTNEVLAILKQLRADGLCVSHMTTGKAKALRWFRDAAMRDAYLLRRQANSISHGTKRGKPLGSIGFKDDAAIVWPAHIVVQTCPSPSLGLSTGTHEAGVL